MVIARELVTKLSFQVDQRAIDNYTRSIIGVKTQFAIAATAVIAFGRTIVNAVSNLSNLVAETEDLSRATGIAFDKLYALGRAAESFGIDPKAFQDSLGRLSIEIQKAYNGAGDLFELMQELPEIQIFNDDGSLKNTLEVFDNIADVLSDVEDEQRRIFLLQKTFNVNGARLSRFFEGGSAGVNAQAARFARTTQDLAAQRKEYAEFQRNLTELTSKFNDLIVNAVNKLTPIAREIIDATNTLLEIYTKIFRFIADSTDKITSFAKGESRANPFRIVGENILGDVSPYSPFETDLEAFSGNTGGAALNVTNNFDVQVAPGTTEQQASQISESAANALESFFGNKVRELINNFPQVE